MPIPDSCFIEFKQPIKHFTFPKELNDPFDDRPHPIGIQAAEELQLRLQNIDWKHNFGLEVGNERQAIGKMFGVLVVKTEEGHVGYLAAFSGKLGDTNEYPGFVPPVCEGLKSGGFLNEGMKALDRVNQEISDLGPDMQFSPQAMALKKSRTTHSNSLQDEIYDGHRFLNRAGVKKTLREIFADTLHANPPGGAGECAAPRLLQYAFQNRMQPIAIAEFWWGRSPHSPQWQHKQYYPACTHKCRPILGHMLQGLMPV